MELAEDGKWHWHQEYIGQNNTVGYRCKKLNEFKKQIEDFSRLWFAEGINIQLCTSSALTCFEHISMEEAMKRR